MNDKLDEGPQQGKPRFPFSVSAAAAALLTTIAVPRANAWSGIVLRAAAIRQEQIDAPSQPAPVLLEPAIGSSASLQHRSHSSHSSHRSHQSHYSSSSGGGTTAPPRAPPVQPPAVQPPKPTPVQPPTLTPASPVRATAHPVDVTSRSIREVLGGKQDHKRFCEALILSGSLPDGGTGRAITICVPTPTAFEAFLTERNALDADAPVAPTMGDILKYHILPKRLAATDLEHGCVVQTLNGQGVAIAVREHVLTLNGARQVNSEITCGDGTIYFVDDLLLPTSQSMLEVLRSDGRFGQFLRGVELAGSQDLLRGTWTFTVLAPTDEALGRLATGAWDNLLKPENRERLGAFIKSHISTGRVFSDELRRSESITTGVGQLPVTTTPDGLAIAGARIAQTDVNAANGVIHVLARPLTLP
jgi:uncharacterized surface protein with fasciclin (FAS1) repeats